MSQVSSVKTPYSSTSTSPSIPTGINVNLAKDEPSRLWFWCGIATIVYVLFALLVSLIIAICGFLGFHIPLFETAVKPRDVEFVLVDNTPTEKPRKPTNRRAEHATRSGGQKVANQPTQVAQQAAGTPAKKSPSRPAAQQQPAARPARQATPQPPRPQVAAARPASRPTPRPTPQPAQQAPTPKAAAPAPAAPAPKLPRPEKIASASPALPPNPIAPTIRTPAPKNPSASGGGPIVKTPGSSTSGSQSSGSSGGSPGPSMIAGNPSRGGGGGNPGASGRPGSSGGSGGRGSYNQVGSPGGGGGRPGIDAEAEPDFGPYIAELQRRIKRNWAPPSEDRNKRVVLVFRISRDGRLVNIQMKGSSGSPTADQAAMAAVKLSAPFRPLPPNYKGSDIPVEFTFDYQVFSGARMR